MDEQIIQVPTVDGQVGREGLSKIFNELGTPIAGRLYARVSELKQARSGAYPLDESFLKLVEFVDGAFEEVLQSLVALELEARSNFDGEPRNVIVELVEDGG